MILQDWRRRREANMATVTVTRNSDLSVQWRAFSLKVGDGGTLDALSRGMAHSLDGKRQQYTPHQDRKAVKKWLPRVVIFSTDF